MSYYHGSKHAEYFHTLAKSETSIKAAKINLGRQFGWEWKRDIARFLPQGEENKGLRRAVRSLYWRALDTWCSAIVVGAKQRHRIGQATPMDKEYIRDTKIKKRLLVDALKKLNISK